MKLSLVAPCYNEEGNVRLFCEEARRILDGIEYEIVFINDGSKDGTLRVLKELYAEKKDKLKIINFSRNFGKEAGLYAGLEHARGDYVVIIDTDMQQPIAYGLSYPERLSKPRSKIDLAALQKLEFFAPDREKFPSFGFADAALDAGGTLPCAMNAANEVAVERFRKGEINFGGIWKIVGEVREKWQNEPQSSFAQITEAENEARRKAAEVKI